MLNLGPVAAGSTIRLLFTTHAQTGAAVAPSSAFETDDVRLYKDGSATERTSQAGWTITSPFDSLTGLHQIAMDLSDNTDAGFYAAGSTYVAVLSPDETVDGLAVIRVIGSFSIGPQAANVTQFGGSAGTFSSGRPEVNTTHAAGTAWNSGAIGAATLATDTITAAKIAADAIGASELAADAVAEIADGVWDEAVSGHGTDGTYGKLGQVPRSNTATAGGATSITLDASAVATDDYYNGCLIVITSGTGVGQARAITDYVGSTKVATTDPAWATNPDNTSKFLVLPSVAGPSAASIAAIQADTDDIQTRLPAALVGGRMDSSVGAMAANVLTATAINADAITAAKVADGTIDAATFATGAIDASAIASNAIAAAKIATGAITNAKFAAGAIDAAAIASDAITAAKIAADAITAAKIADGAIDAATFAAGAINAAAIAADAITDAKVASDVTIASVTGAVGSVTGAVGSVTGNVGGNVTGSVGSVAAGGITATSIATGAIDADALAADAVDAILDEQIGDGTLTMRQALRVLVAGMAGKLSGATTTTVTIRNLADSADVVVATVDANGNRSAVTVTP